MLMMQDKNIKNDLRLNSVKGFSLLELILAVAVFSLSAYFLTTLLIDSGVSTRLNTERIEALSYAKEGIVATRYIRDNSWSDLTAGAHGLVNVDNAWSFSDESELINDKYTRVITVADVPDDVSSSTKNITATVSWSLTFSRQASVVLNTTLTNWPNK
jgi:prepilin-type N-terminal cleavage/methylation domain-containing protein